MNTIKLKPSVALGCMLLLMIIVAAPVDGLSSLLTLYLVHSYGMSDFSASSLFASMTALLFSYSIIGGVYGSRFSYPLGLLFGLLVLAAGALCFYFKLNIILAMSLIVLGYGFAFVNFIAIYGQIASSQTGTIGKRFVLNYMVMNVAGMTGIFVGMITKEYFTTHLYFIFMAADALIGAVFFYWLYPRVSFFLQKGQSNVKPMGHNIGKSFLALLILMAMSAIILDVGLSHEALANGLLSIVALCSFGYVVLSAKKYSKTLRMRTYYFLFLTVITLGFFTLYAVEPNILAVFISHYVNRQIMGFHIPASSYFILNPILNLVIGFSIMFVLMKAKAAKLADRYIYSGVLLMGVGFFVLWAAVKLNISSVSLISTGWIVLTYFVLSLAEMLLAPMCYTIVFEYGLPELYGILSGMTQVAIGLGFSFSEVLIHITIPKAHVVAHHSGLIMFQHGFGLIAIIWSIAGIMLLIFSRPIRQVFLKASA